MNFDLSPAHEAFRREVEAFVREHMTGSIRSGIPYGRKLDTPERRAFVTRMSEKGWLGKGFPKDYGGDGEDDPMAKFVLNYELFLSGAPIIGKNLGQVAGTLMLYGSEALKREFITRTIRNEIQWTICYSEPGAGSDLASMTCRATLEGDEFVINGEKRWISSVHFADHLWMAVRTDPDLPKHKGISLLIVDVNSPGITINPIRMCWDETPGTRERTSTVFFDNVRVPKSRLVGELNRGWYYMMNALNFERFLMLSVLPVLLEYRDLLAWLKTAVTPQGAPLRDDPVLRSRIARLDVLLEMARLLDLRCICMAAQPDVVPHAEAMMNKALGSQAYMELCDVALELMGPQGFLMDGPVEQMPDNYLLAAHTCVAAAGVDVAKNAIARHHLGLPQ